MYQIPKTRFQLSAGLNVETLNAILVEPTIFEPRLKFKPWLKFFKFRWVHSLKYLRLKDDQKNQSLWQKLNPLSTVNLSKIYLR